MRGFSYFKYFVIESLLHQKLKYKLYVLLIMYENFVILRGY